VCVCVCVCVVCVCMRAFVCVCVCVRASTCHFAPNVGGLSSFLWNEQFALHCEFVTIPDGDQTVVTIRTIVHKHSSRGESPHQVPHTHQEASSRTSSWLSSMENPDVLHSSRMARACTSRSRDRSELRIAPVITNLAHCVCERKNTNPASHNSFGLF